MKRATRQLHRFGDDLVSFQIMHQQVNVIGGHHVIKNRKTKALAGFKEPFNPSLPVTGKHEEEFPLMAAVSQMPDHARQIMAMRSRHGLLTL